MCYVHAKGKTFHVCASIAGIEAMSDYRLKKLASSIQVDGVPLRTAAQVRKLLKEARENGYEYIPAEGCDNYDSRGFCLGHEKESNTNE